MAIKPTHSVVYKKIIFSFLLVIVLFSVLSGIIAYVFSSSYEKQVHDDSQIMLTRIGEQMDEKIFQQAHALYADLTTNPTLYPEAISFLRGNSFDSIYYYRLFISLKAALARTPRSFSSVSLYNRNEDSVVSSVSGVKWIQEQKQGKYTDWVSMVSQSKEHIFWQYSEPYLDQEEQVSANIVLYSTYPNNATGENCSGIIRMELHLSALGDILKEYRTEQTSYYLIDKKGNNVVGGVGNTIKFAQLFGDQLSQAGTENYVGVCELNKEKTVILSQPFRQDYILVGVTKLSSFYAKTNALRNRIYLIGLGLVLLGILLAMVLSNRLYQPLRQIVEPARKRYGAAVQSIHDENENEYAYLKELMENLFSKATSMETVWEQNFPLIKDAFFQSLLRDSSISNQMLKEKMDFLHLAFLHPLFCVVRLHIPSNLLEVLCLEQRELTLYGLLGGYNNYESHGLIVNGVKTACGTLTLIINLSESSWDEREVWLHELRNVCVQYCGIYPQICISTPVDSLEKISQANQEAAELEPYFYYLTQYEYLEKARIPVLQSEFEEKIPTKIQEDFVEHIQQKQSVEAQQDVTLLTDCCKTGKYRAKNCNERILSMLFSFSCFVHNMKVEEADSFYEKIHSDFLKCGNIERFEEWFNGLISQYLLLLTKNLNENSSLMMHEITEYINQHLTEQISLELLADTFLLSSSYLSRRFKEETGTNYTDFVNDAKLARAADQLIHTSMHIDEIAEETGFNSSAYFIKKFRQKYGVTPKNYRINTVFRNGK